LRNALDLAVKYQAKLLFASSPAVYGAGTGSMLVKESYVGPVDQLSPRASFAEAKRFGETLTMNYHLQHNIDTKIARIFNCFGPRMGLSDGRMIPELIKSATTGQAVTVYGKETESSSYFYVSDLLRGLIKLMSSNESTPVNFASEWKISLKEVAEKIVELTASKSEIVFADKPANFDVQPLADITSAKEKLSWFPVVLLDEGLKDTIDYLSAQEGVRRPETFNKL
jgi:nucleoside-diphosphate-sugar epimerase